MTQGVPSKWNPFATTPNTEITLDWTYNIKDGEIGKDVWVLALFTLTSLINTFSKVYVLDSGVQTSHPELAGRVQNPPIEYIPRIVHPVSVYAFVPYSWPLISGV